jgi:pimeloyl-ACP methyl ester carboxylesterase
MTTDSHPTRLGRLQIRRAGSGPPVILWHSLFVDSMSWGPLFDRIARDHTVIAIDGPCHGGSEALQRDFTFDEVADSAADVMDALGLEVPIDWVGNAWGGHVGVTVATRHLGRLRTLTTIGTPLRGLNRYERWGQCWPLVQIYRVTGPHRWLMTQLQDALIGPDTVVAQPNRSRAIMQAFATADRGAMFHAMRSMMLHRQDLTSALATVNVPTLMLVAHADTMGAGPDDIRSATAEMTHVGVGDVTGDGHLTPLLVDEDNIYRQLIQHWAGRRTASRSS